MKKFITKVQEIGKKASDIKAAIDTLPGRAAQIRQTITMTASELQQIKTSVQSNLQGLTATSEDHLLKAMKDVSDHAAAFEEAGYQLTELEMDLGLAQRLTVHLQRIQEISHSHLKAVLAGQTNPAVRSIIGGIMKAEETVANVELPSLHYYGLLIHVGPLPLIRLCWTSESPSETVVATSVQAIPTPQGLLNSPTESFFERRTAAIPIPAAAAPTPTVPTVTTSPIAPIAPVKSSQWAKESLDRFKKMPSGSKY